MCRFVGVCLGGQIDRKTDLALRCLMPTAGGTAGEKTREIKKEKLWN